MLNGLNQLIQQVVENNQTNLMYNAFQLLNIPISLIYCVWFGRKLKIGLGKILLFFVTSFSIIYAWMLILHWAFNGFNSFGGQNMVMVFVWVPILALGISKLFRISWATECYIHAASLPLMHGIGHIGCLFKGCCAGYISTWGIYNPSRNTVTFPVQIIETIISLSIAVFLIVRAHKNKYAVDEKQFPLMLIMYGSARFILEFFRDNSKIVLGCSDLAFHALFMLVVGIIWITKINKKMKIEAAPNIPTAKRRTRR